MVLEIISISVALVALGVGGFLFWKSRRLKDQILVEQKKEQKEMDRRMYELAILKELGERIGYSLNVQKIIDVITGSLRQFIDYTAVSYMLLEPEKIIFKVDLENSVSHDFIKDIKGRMLKSLSALLGKDFSDAKIDETLTGAILVDELDEPVRSFFNIPIVIGDKVVGVLTVANTKAGLYKEEEMTILYKITQQASQAVTRLQEVVKTEEGKLNSMVESMGDGVVMTDKDYRIAVVNPMAKKMAGLEDKEEISIFDFIDFFEGSYDIRGKLEESVKLDKVLVTDDVFINDRFYQIFVSPVKSAYGLTKGDILGGVAIFRDITKEKEVEKMRDDFTSMMVHELRSPLDGIKKMSQMLKEGSLTDDAKTAEEFTQMINKSSGDMLELVNDLLDVAKIEAGKIQVDTEDMSIKDVVNERVGFYKSSAEDSKLTLTANIAENVPDNIKGDERRLAQVLNNFISNAIKFTKEGGSIEVQVLLHKARKSLSQEAKDAGIEWFIKDDDKNIKKLKDSVLIAVTDSGVGIPTRDIPKLFSKFTQFKAAAESEKKGTGLGLVIAKGIVESHRGIVGVNSEEGSGSTFYFALPVANQETITKPE